MDRLPAVIAIAVALAGCKDDKDAPDVGSRTNGATVAAKKLDTAAFCDKKFGAETAPAFATPPLAGTLAPTTEGKWRWVNVWATWCKPCVDEIPRILKWQPKLGAEVQFISVDETDDNIAEFRQKHPELPATARLAKPDAQGAWFGQLGLDAAAPIPVHIFVDPSNHVRCVRAGGVREQDHSMVEAVLAGK